jgi:hypothetical protein
MKLKYLLYGFTTFQSITLLGFLGSSYTTLEFPMMILLLILVIFALLLGAYEWYQRQSKVNLPLNNAQILASFTSSFIVIAFILLAVFVGVYIA